MPRVTSFAPQRDHEHLDAAAGVDGLDAFFGQCVADGVTILKPLTPAAWGTKDFYVEDPDMTSRANFESREEVGETVPFDVQMDARLYSI